MQREAVRIGEENARKGIRQQFPLNWHELEIVNQPQSLGLTSNGKQNTEPSMEESQSPGHTKLT